MSELFDPRLRKHDPLPVCFTSPTVIARGGQSLLCYYVEKRGAFIEVDPAFTGAHPLSEGLVVDFMLRFPGSPDFVEFRGTIRRLIPLTNTPEGKSISILSIQFDQISDRARRKIEALEILTASQTSKDRSPRFPVDFPIEPSGVDVMASLHACDISMTGMFVASKAKFQVGKEMRLRFRLPFQREEVAVSARVVWQGEKNRSTDRQKFYGFGVEFTQISPEAKMALAEYNARAQARGITV